MRATSAQIRLAEAIYRCEAHCLVSCELYGSGRVADALLQSARPMTDVFPWLENELRSSEAELRTFMAAVTRVGALIRRAPRRGVLHRAFKQMREARARLIRAMFGTEAQHGAIHASIALALLETLRDSYARAVDGEDLAGYQTSYGLAQLAGQLLDRAAKEASVDFPSLGSIDAAFPSAVPASRLIRPEQLDAAIQTISREVGDRMDVSVSDATLPDQLGEVERLLDDVLDSYDRGDAPVAARLAASLFIRSYDPIREELSRIAPSSEETLTGLLGVELRRAINDQLRPAEVARIGDKIRAELTTGDRGRDAASMGLE